MPFQDIIKEIMEMHHLSQRELAEAIGVHQTTVSQWLLGKKKPGYESIMALYQKFAVEPNLLFGIEK